MGRKRKEYISKCLGISLDPAHGCDGEYPPALIGLVNQIKRTYYADKRKFENVARTILSLLPILMTPVSLTMLYFYEDYLWDLFVDICEGMF